MEQIRAFLEATDEVQFEAANRAEVYGWVSRTLCEQEYWKQSKATKRLLRRYPEKMTGLSRAQMTRLITAYVETGVVEARRYRRHRFAQHYSNADVALPAEVDEARETLSGPCGVPEISTDKKGKQRRLYRRYATPWELLRQVPQFTGHLRPEFRPTELERQANQLSDTQAARQMQEAKRKLFAGLKEKRSA